MTSSLPDATLALDMEVAVRLDGFRWVRWREDASPDAPADSHGRFLARPDNPLSHAQLPALAAMPLAPQPYRYLPRYSADPALAFGVCERVGLFRHGRAELLREPDWSWRLVVPSTGIDFRDDSLAVLLCRGALAWHAGHSR